MAGCTYVGPEGQQGDPRWLRPIPDLAPILLLHLPVYRTKDEVPIGSDLVTKGNMPDRTELERAHSSRQEERESASTLALERERVLQGLVPTTLHLLRTDSTCQTNLAELEASGYSGWQLEQAVINQRIWSLATKTGQYALKRSDTVYKYLEDFLELDTPKLDELFADREAILEQAARDGQYLLKQKGEANLPGDAKSIQDRLQALGLLRDGT